MRSRRFTLSLIGLVFAAVLTGILLVSAFGSASDGQAATVAPGRGHDAAQPAGSTTACFGSADAAEHWIQTGTRSACVRERTPDRTVQPRCVTTADTAEHWIRATGHLPCSREGEPS